MGRYNYTDKEKDFNKVLMLNQNESFSLNKKCSSQIDKLDNSIKSSEELLKSLGMNFPNKTFLKKNRLTLEIKEVPTYELCDIRLPYSYLSKESPL